MTSPSLQDASWDFYWDQMVEPALFVDNSAPVPPGHIRLPSLWTDPGPDGKRNPSFGFATYHAAIPVQVGKTMGIYVRDVFSAYNLYADTELVLSNGTAGTDEMAHKPAFATRTV
ncbi:MAG: hypothetical protein EHM28_01475 [Spirochaetaceae bacterium]|nr:MAG: hypothetical protein EHM28_01475 [Spirochaetaceae bacterium]